jgi:hypothetical protein
MNVAMQAAVFGTARTIAPHTTAGQKWGAVGSGIGVLVVLYLMTALISHHWKPSDLVKGFDGFASTSKLQWFSMARRHHLWLRRTMGTACRAE